MANRTYSHEELMEQLRGFGVKDVVEVARYGSGHINDTFKVETLSGVRYILQRVNDTIFPKPDEMMDNIRQCIERNDSLQTDALDDAIANIGYIFTTADSVVNQELMANFKRYNRLEFYDHTLYSSMRVYNNFHIDGIRCGVGIFGIVIPTINFNDLLLRDGPIQTDEGGIRTIDVDGIDPYFGETPDLIFREENYY